MNSRMYVSYRRPVGLLAGWRRSGPVIKSCRHGQCLLTLPIILRGRQQAKSILTHFLHIQINLSTSLSIKSEVPPWEPIGSRLGAPMDPQMSPRRPPGSPRDPTGSHRKPQEALRKPQEASGSPQEASGSPQEATGSSQEASGSLRKPQEASGSIRKPQEAFRKPQEASGSHRKLSESFRKPPGSLRKPKPIYKLIYREWNSR